MESHRENRDGYRLSTGRAAADTAVFLRLKFDEQNALESVSLCFATHICSRVVS